jgi:hypothetical protein
LPALYQGPLKWRVEQPYRLLNGEVNGQWNWGRGHAGPEVVDDLRKALAADRDLQAMVAHGASDLVALGAEPKRQALRFTFGTNARNRRGLSFMICRSTSSLTPAFFSLGTKTVSVLA